MLLANVAIHIVNLAVTVLAASSTLSLPRSYPEEGRTSLVLLTCSPAMAIIGASVVAGKLIVENFPVFLANDTMDSVPF